MDTRFWGPSGWRLLHLISFQTEHTDVKDVQTFFSLVPYILPCKYCRASFTDYILVDPIPAKLSDFDTWLYRVHNRVNGKLREQKLLTTPDPKWPEIQQRYKQWLSAPCSAQKFIGWDFLFSVAYTTPSNSVPSKPMPGAPSKSHIKTPELQNRWNILTREKRIPYMEQWWKLLGTVLPYQEWRDAWKKAISEHGNPPLKLGRHKMTAWLFAMEKSVCAFLKEITPHNSFEGLCSELSTFSSGCGSSKRSKTCRATKTHARKRLTTRRRTTYKATGGFL
jgi:hypothetical protein